MNYALRWSKVPPHIVRALFGGIFPAYEYEIGEDGQRTGRRRPTQFTSFPEPWPWEEAIDTSGGLVCGDSGEQTGSVPR